MNPVCVFFSNPYDFDFLPYPEDAANNFIKERKNEYGKIGREVSATIHFTLLPVNSKKSNVILDGMGRESSKSYNLVGEINSIEVYADREGWLRKMGEMIKKK